MAVPLNGVPVTAPSSITSPTLSSNVPWFGLASAAGQSQVVPLTTEFSTAGTFTYDIPSVFQTPGSLFDVIVLGAGGGAAGGEAGNAGSPGEFNAVTLTYGTSFPTGTTSFSLTVGAEGVGTDSGNGTAGGNSSVTVATFGTLTGDGGTGGVGDLSDFVFGVGPGNETFNGITYFGGASNESANTGGNAPGGAGSGAEGASVQGGNGAPGAVWIRAYQPS
jgi:hypothetical protein